MDIVLNELVTEPSSSDFKFFGHPFAFLRNIDKKDGNGIVEITFALEPYQNPKKIIYEYDFEGNLVRETDEKIWAADNKNFWRMGINKKENMQEIGVIEVAQTFEDHSYYSFHNIQPEKHLYNRSRVHTGFFNETQFPILEEFNNFSTSSYSSVEEWICGEIVLTRFQKGNIVMFVVSKRNKILSIMQNQTSNYADGDSGTHVYIVKGQRILVWNDGDSPSILLITSQNNYQLTPISQEIILSAQDLKKNWKAFKQCIINMFHKLIDFKLYKMWNINNENVGLFQITERGKEDVIFIIKIVNNSLLISSKTKGNFSIKLDDICYESIKKMLSEISLMTSSLD